VNILGPLQHGRIGTRWVDRVGDGQ